MKSKSLRENAGFIALIFIALAIFAGSYFRVLDSYELETLDLRFRLRPPISTSDNIAIIEIGDDTIAKLGRFPFDRRYHTLLTKALSESDARIILFDLFFSEPEESDKEFEDAVAKAGNVYFPVVFELDPKISRKIPSATAYAARCLEGFNSAAKGIGHINIIPDIDGKFRRASAYIRYEGYRLSPYLSLLGACDYLGISQKDVKFAPGKYLYLGSGIRVPLDQDSAIIVNYSAGWGRSYQHYSYVDIIQSYLAKAAGEKPVLDLSLLNGKICIIGLTALGTVDLHPTPFGSLYPTMGMHAEVINSILKKKFIQRASPEANLVILLFLSAIIAAVVLKTKPVKGLVCLISIIAVLILSGIVIFDMYGIWIDLIYPVFVIVMLYISITLYRYISEWKRRLVIENELQIARKIQESFLPRSTPSIEGLSISVAMFTARQVGGDLYDFIPFANDRLGVMIGDVSGKGVPASLFMAMSVGAFRTFASSGAKPEGVLAGLNIKLINESSSNLFVTIFYSIFDMKNRAFIYSNGGHLPVLYLNKEGKPQFLDVRDGAPLGLLDGPYSGGEIKFGPGDVFIFYTDGVTEAMNQKSDMYGKERLLLAAEKNRHLPPDKMLAEIEKDLRRFERQIDQHDDITIIIVKAV
ncbi:MAG: CHASE2 domain-containing protein [Candidatus Omnitrophica bacterium]|nr:CHASE2 domain-containing protein [Candidatus Omnitrophota bacterium]